MIARLLAALDRWAVTWWPARASTPALVARHHELAAVLPPDVRGVLMAVIDLDAIARELDRRGVSVPRS